MLDNESLSKIEGLRHDMQLLAERVHAHIDRLHAEKRHYLDEQFRETHDLIRSFLRPAP